MVGFPTSHLFRRYARASGLDEVIMITLIAKIQNHSLHPLLKKDSNRIRSQAVKIPLVTSCEDPLGHKL